MSATPLIRKIRHTETLGCYGVSPVTNKRVGSRHSWGWLGRCRFCGRTKDQVRHVEIQLVPVDGGAA
ncbi:hypothetical protein AA13594_2279 [Gluconacetobacter azotocaptans DSM 13594]|nr:hypothetical protein AA13594_2279 [Gluconacetobacter azotocaptans DSM 13594]